MKKMTLFIATVLVINACSKSNGADPALLENYPQTWILTREEVANEYLFLKTNGAVFYKDNVPTSYSLIQLAEDEKCEFEINTSRTEDNSKQCYTIRLDKNKDIWCGASPSSDKQEIHLTALNSSGDPGDGYKWFIHKMPDENGVKTVVLENVYYTGYYISSGFPGSQFAQNLAVLQQASSPEKATAWQCR